MTNITKSRFIISNSLIGQNLIISFTNKKGEQYTYDHDQVYANNATRLLEMNCFIKYGNYTNSNKLPNWAK